MGAIGYKLDGRTPLERARQRREQMRRREAARKARMEADPEYRARRDAQVRQAARGYERLKPEPTNRCGRCARLAGKSGTSTWQKLPRAGWRCGPCVRISRAGGAATLAAACALMLAVVPVHAGAAHNDEHDLVRVLVAESGPHLTADHAAIMHVLERRGARVGRTAVDVARRYSPALRAPRGYWGRTVAAASPRELEAVAPHVVALVRGWLAGERPADPCRGAADHWGAPMGADWERATRAGWRRVHCGATANAFWREGR